MENKKNKIFLFLGTVFGLLTVFLFYVLTSAYNDLMNMILKIGLKEDTAFLNNIFRIFRIVNLGQLGNVFLSAWCFAWYFAKIKK